MVGWIPRPRPSIMTTEIFFSTRTSNVLWQKRKLKDHRWKCTVSFMDYARWLEDVFELSISTIFPDNFHRKIFARDLFFVFALNRVWNHKKLHCLHQFSIHSFHIFHRLLNNFHHNVTQWASIDGEDRRDDEPHSKSSNTKLNSRAENCRWKIFSCTFSTILKMC